MKKGIDYISVDELPIEQQDQLINWLQNKTLPKIDNQDGIFCYKADYDYFMNNIYKGILVKCFKGWITPQITSSECNETWYNTAIKAKSEKNELIVFQIPMGNPELIKDIEKLLQEKLKK